MRVALLSLFFFLLLTIPALATNGVEPNSWDYSVAQWSPHLIGLNAQTTRLEHDWNQPLTELDAKVNASLQVNAKPIILLTGTRAPNITQYIDVAKEVALRYRYNNIGVEIWNEPNTERFWGSTPSVDEYAALLTASYASIKSVAPETRVILGGPAATPDDHLWIQSVLQLAQADAVGVHPYATTPNGVIERVNRVRALTYLPISVTEFGWGSFSPNCTGSLCVDEDAQANYLATSLYLLSNLGYVSDAIIYELQDAPVCIQWDCVAGLIRKDGTHKPSYNIFQNFNQSTPPVLYTPTPTHQPTVSLWIKKISRRKIVAKGRTQHCHRVKIVLRRSTRKRVLYTSTNGTYRKVIRRLHKGRYRIKSHCSSAASKTHYFRIR